MDTDEKSCRRSVVQRITWFRIYFRESIIRVHPKYYASKCTQLAQISCAYAKWVFAIFHLLSSIFYLWWRLRRAEVTRGLAALFQLTTPGAWAGTGFR